MYNLTDNEADKGNATVIMDTIDYHKNIKKLINDEDPTENILKKLKSMQRFKRFKENQPTTIQ